MDDPHDETDLWAERRETKSPRAPRGASAALLVGALLGFITLAVLLALAT